MTMQFQPAKSVDWSNQAVSLIGGITAQSYQSLGFLKLAHDTDLVSFSLGDNEQSLGSLYSKDSLHQAVETDFFGSQGGRVEAVGRLNSEFVDVIGFLEANITEPAQSDTPTLGASPGSSELNFSGLFSELPESESSGQDAPTVDVFSSTASSLLDLLQQTVDQTPAQRDAFADAFSGERQGALRSQLEDTGAGLREFFAQSIEEQTGGRLQGEVRSVLESFNLEQDDSVDFYATGQQLISDVVDAAVQPIGSVALPMVGPSLVAIREEYVSI
jgi:hypothetical protein